MLPLELKTRALRRARKRGISFAALVRETLASYLEQTAAVEEDALLSDSAVFKGKVPGDFSANHDRYLYGDES